MVVAKADGDRMVLLLPWMDTAATDRRYLVMTLHGSNDNDDDDDGDVVKDGRSYMEISLVRTRDVHSSRGHISYGNTVTVTIGKVVLVSWWWSLRRSRESVSFIDYLLSLVTDATESPFPVWMRRNNVFHHHQLIYHIP